MTSRFAVLDQVMPLDFDGRKYFVVLKECKDRDEALAWTASKSMADKEYKIIELAT